MNIEVLIGSLPIAYAFNDFEEIIYFAPWLRKNRQEIKSQFSALNKILKKNHDTISTSAFSIAVLQELILLTGITYLFIYLNDHRWRLAVIIIIAFFLHLFVYVWQWNIFRKYVPFIVTSLLPIPFCFYALIPYYNYNPFDWGELVLWSLIGMVIMIPSLFLAFYWAKLFKRWRKKYFYN